MSQPINVEEGMRYGNLEVLENLYLKGIGYLKVKCNCGTIEIKRKWPITCGQVKECLSCTKLIRAEKRKKGIGELTGTILGKIKRNAEVRNLQFDVTEDYLYGLYLSQGNRCALSNMEISLENEEGTRGHTASLDRIDSKQGYIVGNLQWVHRDINMMKQDLDEEYFKELCQSVVHKKNGVKPKIKVSRKQRAAMNDLKAAERNRKRTAPKNLGFKIPEYKKKRNI